MQIPWSSILLATSPVFNAIAIAQQHAGETIDTKLPFVPGSEITFFKIQGPTTTTETSTNLTLINYMSLNSTGGRPDPRNLQRAVIVVHGLNRDPGTYESNMLSALSQVDQTLGIDRDNVAIMAPYFAGGADKRVGFPWDDGKGSTTSALVWYASQWSGGAFNQYPRMGRVASSFDVMDQIVQWFGDNNLFPNMKQIVVAGHSLGGQFVQRYAAVGKTATQLGITVPINYWIGDPNSLAWMSLDRPLSISGCPAYDVYREGYTDYELYGSNAGSKRGLTYNLDLVDSGRAAIRGNFASKAINWFRATLDFGDHSSSCSPYTTGKDRNERFFEYIKAFPADCTNPRGNNCDTVDYVKAGHDAGALFASPAGRARLFTDNWDGDGQRAYDSGYPRQATYDDPYPDPSYADQPLLGNDSRIYASGMTYRGCWSDLDKAQTVHSLRNNSYTGSLTTREYCVQICVTGGYKIAGLEGGNQCWCGNALTSEAVEVVESSCHATCAGDSSQHCGGNARLSLLANDALDILPAPKNPNSVGDFMPLGCYREASNGRALTARSTSSAEMTIESCSAFCDGFKYFGTEYGRECYCGNTIASTAAVTDSADCNMACAGDELEYCGAGNRLTIYQNSGLVPDASVTTSAARPAQTASGIRCPGSDGSTYESNGKTFAVECGVDHRGGDLTSVTAPNLAACIDACADNDQCVDVSLSGTACYLKRTVVPAADAPGVLGGRLITSAGSTRASQSATSSLANSQSSPSTSTVSSTSTATDSQSTSATGSTSIMAEPTSVSCPISDGTTWTASSGRRFVIECGIDHPGGDIGVVNVHSLTACIAACDYQIGCVDVSLSGVACYLKGSLERAVKVDVIYGAKLVE